MNQEIKSLKIHSGTSDRRSKLNTLARTILAGDVYCPLSREALDHAVGKLFDVP